MNKQPQEQMVGHSLSELESIFTAPLSHASQTLPDSPTVVSLEKAGIHAYYTSLLIDGEDFHKLEALVESAFSIKNERVFNDCPVRRYNSAQNNQDLILLTSTREFNAVTARVVTNSTDFLTAMQHEAFVVPPPWVAFEGYRPEWWSNPMQGAQGYYNDHYFLPFFTPLSEVKRRAYYSRYQAIDEWVESLESMHEQ